MTVICEQLAAGREVAETAFADITPSKATVDWCAEGLRVTFADDLTPVQVRAVRRRILAASPAEETLLAQLEDLATQKPTTDAARLLRLEKAVLALTKLVARDVS